MAKLRLESAKHSMVEVLKEELTHITILPYGHDLGETVSYDTLTIDTPDRRGTILDIKTSINKDFYRVTNSVSEGDALIFGAIGGMSYDRVCLGKKTSNGFKINALKRITRSNTSSDHVIFVRGFKITMEGDR